LWMHYKKVCQSLKELQHHLRNFPQQNNYNGSQKEWMYIYMKLLMLILLSESTQIWFTCFEHHPVKFVIRHNTILSHILGMP
jgi:hypothetical protein